MTVRAIAKAVGHSKRVVHAFLKGPDGYGAKKSTGRPRQLKTRGRTRLRQYAATGEYTANKLQKELCIDASVRIVQRELRRCEHLAYEEANKSSCMTERHMKLRVEWVERQLRNRTDWSRVVFSDEKKFNLDGPGGCKYYCHDLRDDKEITWCRHSGGGSVTGNQDAFDDQQTLTTYLFELTDSVHDGDYVFQRDNASIHRARATKNFLADLNVPIMDWSALSPDLNPVENLWGVMARRVYKNTRQYSSIDKLKAAISAVCDEISVDLLEKLSSSKFDRCIAAVRSKGKKIAY